MMKGIRRSIKGEKGHQYENKSTAAAHLSITPKAAITIQPPKKVIKALYDYQPNTDQELGFSRGDFFHVIGNENDSEWYEACNPATNARGLVPVAYFQILGKNERDSADSGKSLGSLERAHGDADSGYSEKAGARKSVQEKSGGPLYGIVMFDFRAERADELDAKAGEAVIVIAQSNKEWFVAKPIGRLGGPGLIPVGFIEIRDMITNETIEDKDEAIARAGVPKVEEWKRRINEYKNSSISLGSFSDNQQPQHAPHENGHVNGQGMIPPQRFSRMGSMSMGPFPISASVDDYTFEDDRYWYILNCTMDDGRHWALRRYYEDFYDCQVALLRNFPVEAGQNDPQQRTLPFMPGPVTFVTDAISRARRSNLDDYIKQLLQMPPHISQCQLIRELFSPRPNDLEQKFGGPKTVAEAFPQRNSMMSQHSNDSSRELSRQPSSGKARNNSIGQTHQAHQVHMRAVSDLQPPRMLREGSNASTATTQQGQQNFIKVKVQYGDDMIALRLPRDISLAILEEKLVEKLGPVDLSSLQYRDESSLQFVNLISDHDLYQAIARNSKLVLIIN